MMKYLGGWIFGFILCATSSLVSAQAATTTPFQLRFDGYLRAEAFTFVPGRFFGIKTSKPGRDAIDVGTHDGFDLSDARLNITGQWRENFSLRISFDASTFDQIQNNPVGRMIPRLRDAYARYKWNDRVGIVVGRFRVPYDTEEMTATRDQYFVQRSLESRGVRANEGLNITNFMGMALGRQTGVMVSGDRLMAWDKHKIGYALAVTNGNSGDSFYNDNDLPAVYGRVMYSWWGDEDREHREDEGPITNQIRSGGHIGLAANFNTIERIDQQTNARISDQLTGVGTDFAWDNAWWRLAGQALMMRDLNRGYVKAKPDYALGGHVQISFKLPFTRLLPGYRFAAFDPSSQQKSNLLMHHTVGVRYLFESIPVLLLANYTHSIEQKAARVSNDRVEVATQVNF